MKLVTFRNLGLMGELGNQMFQVAATIGYARKNGFKEKFPLWECKISGSNYSEIFSGSPDQTLSSSDYDGPTQIFSYQDLIYKEIPKVDTHLDLNGYFQSEKYFNHCEKEIRSIFKPSNEIKSYLERKYPELIGDHDFVAVHIRTGKRDRSDYDVHSYCTREYLEEAFSKYPEDKKFVIFSDRMEMAKEMIPQGKDCTFISGEKNYIDLFLLTHFKNYIISASTFGWWGAWLSKYDSPNVTIMKNWFNPMGAKSYLNNNDISLDKWEKI